MAVLEGSSTLIAGASGTGKSTLARGALEYYGSGLVLLAPGMDEVNSYAGLQGKPEFKFADFDDLEFYPALKMWKAEGHNDLVKFLMNEYKQLKQLKAEGKELPYKVLIADTYSSMARLAFNATLAKFNYEKPPAAVSPDGAAFYGYLRINMEAAVRQMRAIRGLGIHWICLAHPVESEVKEIQKTDLDIGKTKVMADIPGGYKNSFSASFDVVLNTGIGKREVQKNGKTEVERFHYAQWGGDPKRVTKSRLGALGDKGSFVLPKSAKMAWGEVQKRVDEAVMRMNEGG